MERIPKAWSYIIVIAIISVFLAGCSSEPSWESVTDGESVVQVSTIDALLNGVYDGVMDMKTLKQYGDFGIGTFDSLDGEMVVCEGEVYKIRADGKAYGVEDTETTPFASVTFFESDREIGLESGMDFAGLEEYMGEVLPTANIFYAIKIDGSFTYMKTRSVPAQKKPYPRLSEVTASQPEFKLYDVSGTIVGFCSPPYVSAINVPGYHLHFITDDRDAGGHILDFNIEEATAYIDDTPQFMMLLPESDSDFYEIDLSKDYQMELEEVEK